MTSISNQTNLNTNYSSIPAPTSSLEESSWQGSLTKLVKAAGYLLVFAGAAAGAGSLVKMGGERLVSSWAGSSHVLSSVGKISTFAGDKLFHLGKYAFLAVSVPVYTVGWVAPKWIVTKGIPQAASFTARYVLTPVANSLVNTTTTITQSVIVPLARVLGQGGTWIWKSVLLPVAHGFNHALSFVSKILATTAHKIYAFVIKPVAHGIVKATTFALDKLLIGIQKINSYVLQPIAQGLTWTWNTVLIPTCKAIGNGVSVAAHKIYSLILKPTALAARYAAKWIWNAALVPLAQLTVQGAAYFKNLLIATIQKTYTLVLKPIALAAKWIWNAALVPLAHLTAQATNAVKNIFITVALALYKYLLKPLGMGIALIVKWTWNTALLPVLKGVGVVLTGVVRLAQAIYQYVFLPTGQFIGRTFQILGSSTARLIRSVGDLTQSLTASVYETFQRLRQVVVT